MSYDPFRDDHARSTGIASFFLRVYLILMFALVFSNIPTVKRGMERAEAVKLHEILTERENYRDQVLGGAIAHQTGIERANQIMFTAWADQNLSEAEWLHDWMVAHPERAKQLGVHYVFHGEYY